MSLIESLPTPKHREHPDHRSPIQKAVMGFHFFVLRPIAQRLESPARSLESRLPTAVEKNKDEKIRVIALVGINGSGKGTLCKRFTQEVDPDYEVVPTGEIARLIGYDVKEKRVRIEEVEEDGAKITKVVIAEDAHVFSKKYGEMLQEAGQIEEMRAGRLIADKYMIRIVRNELDERLKEGKRKFIFDGFPRTIGQYDELLVMMEELREQGMPVSILPLTLEMSEKQVKARADGRRAPVLKRIEKLKNKIKKLETVGASYRRVSKQKAKLAKEVKLLRDDDEPTKVENRIKVFKEHTAPAILTVAQRAHLIAFVSAGQTAEEVYAEAIDRLQREERPVVKATRRVARRTYETIQAVHTWVKERSPLRRVRTTNTTEPAPNPEFA